MNQAVGALMVAILLLFGIVVARAETEGGTRSPGAQSDGLPPSSADKAGSRGGTEAGDRPAGQPTPRYYDEQLLNYRLTEFCSVMKRPPQSLIQAVDNAAQTEEGKKSPAVIEGYTYLHILDQMVRERCGDA